MSDTDRDYQVLTDFLRFSPEEARMIIARLKEVRDDEARKKVDKSEKEGK